MTVSWYFHSFPFLSPRRKTLQLNWTGATESPLFPQADFSGNHICLLAFAGSLINIFLKSPAHKIQWIPLLTFFFSLSLSKSAAFVSMWSISCNAPGLWMFLCTHIYMQQLYEVCTHASVHTHTWTQHCFLEAELCCWESAFVAAVECSGLVILHTLGWAGPAWRAVGHRGGGLTDC